MTGHAATIDGIPIFIPNDITAKKNNFYISYNETDRSTYGDVTTALVLDDKEGTKFLILNGNHTRQYGDIIAKGGDYIACMQYFKDNEASKSAFSEDWDKRFIFKDGGACFIPDTRFIKGEVL